MAVKRKIVAALAGLALGAVALECTAAPQSQCQDGSTRTRTVQHRPVRETCHNGEWVKGK